MALPVGPCANRKTVISFSHFFIRVLLSGSALSYPSAIMRLLAPLFASALLAALAVASTAVAQVRIGKLDSGKEFSRGESGFSRALHFSALFSFARHEAFQGRELARRTRAGQRKREKYFSVFAAKLFERSTCRPCSQGFLECRRSIVSVARYSYSLPAVFFLPSLRNTTRKGATVASSLGATKEQGGSMRVVPRKYDVHRVSSG